MDGLVLGTFTACQESFYREDRTESTQKNLSEKLPFLK